MHRRPRSRKSPWWAFVGLSSGAHAIGLLLLPALLGLGWVHWRGAGAPSPAREVRVVWNWDLPAVEPVSDPEPLPEAALGPDREPDLPELESDFEPSTWEPVPSAELERPTPPEPIEALWRTTDAADWAESLTSTQPTPIIPEPEPEPEPEFEVEPVAPAPPPASADAPPGEPIDAAWDPTPWDVYCPTPDYPLLAQRRRWEGTALLQLEVGADGVVRQVHLIESSGFELLDQAALQALARWRFHPGPLGAKPRTIERRVQFRLL